MKSKNERESEETKHQKLFHEIFRKGSVTFYYSSLFFPKSARKDVFTLYAYVRTADDYVDKVPQDKAAFFAFVKRSKDALNGKKTDDAIIDLFASMVERRKIKHEWIFDFLKVMEWDLTLKKYKTFEDVKEYMYGSAEVIGLMMAKILDLDERAFEAARLQGRAMQFINIIRDSGEDICLGRTYIPQEDLAKFGLKDAWPKSKKEVEQFKRLYQFEIKRYFEIQKEARAGYRYIPLRYRLPVKTAADMYDWAALEILKNPSIVVTQKIKPSKWRVLLQFIWNVVSLPPLCFFDRCRN